MISTCPWCGHHDRTVPVEHPLGRFFCACGSLFWGTDSEFRRLAQHRRAAIERRVQHDHVTEEAS